MSDFLNNVIDSAKEKFSNATENLTGRNKKGDSNSGSAPNSAADSYMNFISKEGIGPKLWYTEGADWYKVFGYRFSIAYVEGNNTDIETALSQYKEAESAKSKGSGGPFSPENLFSKSASEGKKNKDNVVNFLHFTLPIPPQSLVVKPVIPSRVTATLGGVVEESSQVKFWITNMSGTTGTSVSRLEKDVISRNTMANKFREALETTGLFAGVVAQGNDIINKIGNIADGILENGFTPSGLTGVINDALTPSLPYSKSAVDNKTNGFVEAQELQKFFYIYSALKARYPKKYALMFTNFKTDQSFRCVVKDFQLLQSADSPYLFKYNISLQCWGVRASRGLFAGTDGVMPTDRFGPGGDLSPVNTITSDQTLDILAGNGNSLLRGLF